MSVFKGYFHSDSLGMRTAVTAILPDKKDDKPMRVIYLLHGLSDNADVWADQTMAAVYANEYNVAFICPEVQRSFYGDMDYGLNYFTYVADELPEIVSRIFNVSSRREDRAVMGLSMGGFGALKVALMRPEQYFLCCPFSSAISPLAFMMKDLSAAEEIPAEMKEWIGVFGRRSRLNRDEDLRGLAEEVSRGSVKPVIHMTCGKQDFLYEQNVSYSDFLKTLDLDFRYDEWDGVHNWYFWNDSLKLMLETYFKTEI